MWVVVSLIVVVYASLTTGYQYQVVPVVTEIFFKHGLKHGRLRYQVVPAISARNPYDIHNLQQGNHGGDQPLYPNLNYNDKLQPHAINNFQGNDLQNHHLPRENNALEEYLYQYPSLNTRIQNYQRYVSPFSPLAQLIYQNYKRGCLHCVSKYSNEQNVIHPSIPSLVNAAPYPDYLEAHGNNPTTFMITNEHATAPYPGTSEYINPIIKQNAQQGFNTKTYWKSVVNGGPNPDSSEGQGNNPTPTLTNDAATWPDPGISEYINSINDSPEAQGKNPTPYITNDAATKLDPGISQYIYSIKDSLEAQGKDPTTTLTNDAATWPDAGISKYIYSIKDSPEAQGKNPTPTITNDVATWRDPAVSEYFYSIKDSPVAQGKNPTPIITNDATTGPDPGVSEHIYAIKNSPESQGKNPTQTITNDVATGPDPGTSEYINSIMDTPEAQEKNPTPTFINDATTGLDPGVSEHIYAIKNFTESQGKNPTQTITNDATTGLDPGTSEYTNSIKDSPEAHGKNLTSTLTNDAVTLPDPGTPKYINLINDSLEAQGNNSTPTITNDSATSWPDTGTSEYINLINDSQEAQEKNPTPTITNDSATWPHPGTSEYINSIKDSPEAQGHNPTPTFTNDAATEPDPGTSEYINSITKPIAQQRINMRTIWRSAGNGGPDLDFLEAQRKSPTPTIINHLVTDPGTSKYINSIIKQYARQGIHTRKTWRSALDEGPDPDSPEAQGKNRTPTITNETATGPDPGTSKYINSINKQNAQEGINTRTIWRSIVDGGPDPGSEEANNSRPIKPITNEAATGPDPGTSEYINAINKQNADKVINRRTIWRSAGDGGPDPDYPEAQGKNPTQPNKEIFNSDIDDDATYATHGSDLGTSWPSRCYNLGLNNK